jgi:hypothetical protein
MSAFALFMGGFATMLYYIGVSFDHDSTCDAKVYLTEESRSEWDTSTFSWDASSRPQ